MLGNRELIPLTLDNIEALIDDDKWGHFCVGTEKEILNVFNGAPNRSGYLKQELTKEYKNRGDGYCFQFEIV